MSTSANIIEGGWPTQTPQFVTHYNESRMIPNSTAMVKRGVDNDQKVITRSVGKKSPKEIEKMVGDGVKQVEKKGDIAFVTMTSKSYAQAVINGSGDKSQVSAYVERRIEPTAELSKKWKRIKRWLEERIRELERRVERLELQQVVSSPTQPRNVEVSAEQSLLQATNEVSDDDQTMNEEVAPSPNDSTTVLTVVHQHGESREPVGEYKRTTLRVIETITPHDTGDNWTMDDRTERENETDEPTEEPREIQEMEEATDTESTGHTEEQDVDGEWESIGLNTGVEGDGMMITENTTTLTTACQFERIETALDSLSNDILEAKRRRRSRQSQSSDNIGTTRGDITAVSREKSLEQNGAPVERLGGLKKRQATMLRFVARGNDDDNTPVKENGKRVSHSLSAEKARKRPLATAPQASEHHDSNMESCSSDDDELLA